MRGSNFDWGQEGRGGVVGAWGPILKFWPTKISHPLNWKPPIFLPLLAFFSNLYLAFTFFFSRRQFDLVMFYSTLLEMWHWSFCHVKSNVNIMVYMHSVIWCKTEIFVVNHQILQGTSSIVDEADTLYHDEVCLLWANCRVPVQICCAQAKVSCMYM